MFQKSKRNRLLICLGVLAFIMVGCFFMQPDRMLAAGFATNLTGWTASSGTWANTADGRQGVAAAGDIFTVASENGRDFSYEADIAITGNGTPGAAGALLFRANGDGSQCYAVNVSTENGGLVKLFRFPYAPIMVYNTSVKVNYFYHLKVVASGSNIRVYLNNGAAPVINVNDSTYSSGRFGLNVWNGKAVFQNVMRY